MEDRVIIRAGTVMAFMMAKGLSFNQACDLAQQYERVIWTPNERKDLRNTMEIIFQSLDS